MRIIGQRFDIFNDEYSILEIVVFFVLSTSSAVHSLSGEHVCSRTENYTITSRETYFEPVIVQTFTWCLQVPPRCPKTRIENRQRYRVKSQVEERSVSECCDGYVLQELHGDAETQPKCVPYCADCRHGLCLAPNTCQCEPGYQSENCEHECPPGSWGRQCMQQCECPGESTCDPITGICECPAGWQGPECKFPCAIGRWGFRCASTCDCAETENGCEPESGRCYPARNSTSENWTRGDLFRVVQSAQTTVVDRRQEVTTEVWRNDRSDMKFRETESRRDWRTLENVGDFVTPVYASEEASSGTSETTTTVSESSESPASDLETRFTKFRETTRSLVVSRDEDGSGRLNLLGTIASEISASTSSEDTMRGATEATLMDPEEEKTASHVNTIQKERDPQVPFDVTLLVVVGSVVTFCLTFFVILMIFYLRAKLFDSIPINLYRDEKKTENNAERTPTTSKFTNTALPALPTFMNPVFNAANQESALITFDDPELNKHYANRTATISIRVSGNIRELLESHYDRPPAATCCRTPIDSHTEHVYDEIPLTIPLCVRKET